MNKVLTFVGWILFSSSLLSGCSALFQSKSQQSSKPQTTSTQVVVQTPKAETPTPVVVSAEYKMFRSAGASPEKAQALSDACTADENCPTTFEIAEGVVRGEMTLILVPKPNQPCTEDELKKGEESGGYSDSCYSKSAEGRKSIREAEAANKAQENKPSAVESWKDAAVLAESQPNSDDLADKAEKARLEAIVEIGKNHGLSKAYVLCSASIRGDENGMAIEECDAEGNKHPL